MKTILKWTFALSAVMILVTACKKDPASPSPTKYSNFKIYLTDAPADAYQEVNVEVLQVEIHSSGGGWEITDIVNPGIYNLLDYTNGLDTLIFNDSLPVGKVSQIRLILGDNNTIMVDSVVYPLATPSAQQSGLKLQIHKELEANTAYAIILDFDVAKSVVETGNGEYILKPVLRTIVEGVAGVLDDGAIEGVIVPAIFTPVFAINGTDTLGAFTNANGAFLIQGAAAGTYDLMITPLSSSYNDTTITGVVVVSGVTTDAGTINL